MQIRSLSVKEIGIVSLTAVLLVLIFYFAPVESGRDWAVMNRGLQRFVSGQPVYELTYFEDGGYVYYLPPWLTVLLSPLAFLPEKLNWALVCSISVFAILPLAKRYNLGIAHIILLYLSPPVLYNLRQGNIDIILLLIVFAPLELWPLLSLTKPHVVGGLPFSLIRQPQFWARTFLISALVLLLSFAFFGLWPLAIAEMSSLESLGDTPHNQLSGLWPLQLIVAVGILVYGFDRQDERYFMSASPFLLSYATIGNFIGLTLCVISAMKWWQALALVITWWIVLIFT